LLIVFDASSIVGAALKQDSVPMRALLVARGRGTLVLSGAVYHEVLSRQKFAESLTAARREAILALLTAAAIWFDGGERVIDCSDPADNKYLELALWSGAEVIVSSDKHLRNMHPWRGVMILSPATYLAST
jgi:putative PIN family toxin of toxin-antitoxin system